MEFRRSEGGKRGAQFRGEPQNNPGTRRERAERREGKAAPSPSDSTAVRRPLLLFPFSLSPFPSPRASNYPTLSLQPAHAGVVRTMALAGSLATAFEVADQDVVHASESAPSSGPDAAVFLDRYVTMRFRFSRHFRATIITSFPCNLFGARQGVWLDALNAIWPEQVEGLFPGVGGERTAPHPRGALVLVCDDQQPQSAALQGSHAVLCYFFCENDVRNRPLWWPNRIVAHDAKWPAFRPRLLRVSPCRVACSDGSVTALLQKLNK